LPCLFAVAIAVAGSCSGDEEPGISPGQGGASGGDGSAGSGGAGGSNTGGSGGSGGADAGWVDATGDVNWGAMCGAFVPSGPGSCLWACGCQQCARVTAECLANSACQAIIDCSLQQRCSNDPDAGANFCQVKCAKVILDNYTAGGMRAAAFDQCATTACRLACLPDAGPTDAAATPDATVVDAPADVAKPDAPPDVTTTPDAPPDITTVDAPADVTTPDAPPDVTTVDAPPDAPADVAAPDASADTAAPDAPAESAPTDAPAEAEDAPETDTAEAASD